MPIDKTPWTDDTVFTWGEHNGKRVADAPPEYLLWLSEQKWIVDWPGLHTWLKANEQRFIDARNEDHDPTRIGDSFQNYEDYLRDRRGY